MRGVRVMKNFGLVLSLVIGSWVATPTPVAQASWLGDLWSSWWNSGGSAKVERYKARVERHKKLKKHKKNHAAVPELDPSAAGGAMVLMLGGVAYIASRRREDDLV